MKKVLLLLPLFFIISSCSEEQFYAGVYTGSVNARVYSFDDNDLTGSYTQGTESVSFAILSDDEGDFFTWNNCFISQGAFLPSPDPVYLNRRGKGKLNYHFEQDIWEFDIEIQVNINQSGVMQYEAKVLECIGPTPPLRLVVYEGELQR